MSQEKILVVQSVYPNPLPQHFCLNGYQSIANRPYFLFPRADGLEMNEEYKQVIPYVIIRAQLHPAAGGEWCVLMYARASSGGEARLHNKLSIGIGGHINDDDCAHDSLHVAAAITACAQRELHEELIIYAPYTLQMVGSVNHDDDEVGRVHFGILVEAVLQKPISGANLGPEYMDEPDGRRVVCSKSRDVRDSRFVPVSELGKFIAGLEKWSAIVAQEYLHVSTES